MFFSFRAVSEIDRVGDILNSNRPFEHEAFDAKRMDQPDLFRLEMRGQKHKWMSPRGFIAGSKVIRKTSPVDEVQRMNATVTLRNSKQQLTE